MGVKKSRGKKKVGINKSWGKKKDGKNPIKKKWINNILWIITMTTNYYQLLEIKLLGGVSYKIQKLYLQRY